LVDAGRVSRPLLIVETEDGKQKLKIRPHTLVEVQERNMIMPADDEEDNAWTYLLSNGYIEYLDADEEECSMIAMGPDELYRSRYQEVSYCSTYTHCEIHPSMILGVCASLIPFPHHNQVTFLVPPLPLLFFW